MGVQDDLVAGGKLVWLAEADIFLPSSGGDDIPPALIWGNFVWGGISLGDLPTLSLDALIRVSDGGYISQSGDSIGALNFRAILQEAIDIDRQLDLEPSGFGAVQSWGELVLANVGGTLDTLVSKGNTDGRRVRVLYGVKPYDRARKLWTDPSYDALETAFVGVVGVIDVAEDTISLPLRDVAYKLDTAYQTAFYAGTGGREGTDDIEGQPKPRLRGGTPSNPCRNITPVLIDPVNLIYQVSDGPGTIEAVYQRGYGGDIAFQGTTGDLYSGSTSPGHYRYESTSNGLFFQLGSPPEGEITVDACGWFREAGAQTQIGAILRYIMEEDVALSSADIDASAWADLDSTYGYEAAIFVGQEAIAADVINEALAGIGARLLTTRAGLLRPYVLKPPAISTTTHYGRGQITKITSLQLPEDIGAAAWRIRVGYARNHTIQTSDLAAAVSEDRRQWLANEWRYGVWSDQTVRANFEKPGDITIPSVLTRKADAEDVANRLGALWGVARRLYDVEMGLQPLERDIGDTVSLSYDIVGLRNQRRLGVIVGEQIRSGQGQAIIKVLV